MELKVRVKLCHVIFPSGLFKVHVNASSHTAHAAFNFSPESAGANEFAHLQPATSRTAAFA